MSDPHQYDDSSAPARSAGHADAAADPVNDPYAPDQPTARRARGQAPADPPGHHLGGHEESVTDPSRRSPQHRDEYSAGRARSADSAPTRQSREFPDSGQAVATQQPATQAVATQQPTAEHRQSATPSPTHGIHVPVGEHTEPQSKIFSNLNLNGPVPARVRPAIGEWGPKQVPSTKSKKRARVMVNVWFVVALLAILALGYFFFMALTGRPLFG